jgi:hypothetical protein
MQYKNSAATQMRAIASRGHSISEVGLGRDLLQGIVKQNKGNPVKQAAVFARSISQLTRDASMLNPSAVTLFRADLIEIIYLLRKLNMNPQNISEISNKQMRAAFSKLVREDTPEAKVANLRRSIRKFGRWIGKPGLGDATLVESNPNT